MNRWPDSRSPWGMQLRFDQNEFETMMDACRRGAGPNVFVPRRGVDVDLVLLKVEGLEADYVDLPDGVLGRTLFPADGTVQLEVSRALCEAAATDVTARRRLRTTLAHECGHIVCHRSLFVRDTETLSLFAPDACSEADRVNPPMLCRNEQIGPGYQGEWWEYQANQCMAALLLPRDILARSVNRALSDGAHDSVERCITRGEGSRLIATLSSEFDVSETAVMYRMQALGFIRSTEQAAMRFDS